MILIKFFSVHYAFFLITEKKSEIFPIYILNIKKFRSIKQFRPVKSNFILNASPPSVS